MSRIKADWIIWKQTKRAEKFDIITICKYLVIIYNFATLTVNNPNV